VHNIDVVEIQNSENITSKLVVCIWYFVELKLITLSDDLVHYCVGGRPTNSEWGMAENVGLAVGISLITNSIPEVQSTSGLQSAILNSGSRPTSGNVGSVTSESGVVETVGLAVGILLSTARF